MSLLNQLIYVALIVYSLSGFHSIRGEESSTVCELCVSRFNWTHCEEQSRPVVCSEELVSATHNFLAQYNPVLNSSSGDLSNTSNDDQKFRCFRLQLEINIAANDVLIRGCTYAKQSPFCAGWSANGAKAIRCALCDESSECDQDWENATLEPLTTTTAIPTSTTETASDAPCISSLTTTSAVTTTTDPATPTTTSVELPTTSTTTTIATATPSQAASTTTTATSTTDTSTPTTTSTKLTDSDETTSTTQSVTPFTNTMSAVQSTTTTTTPTSTDSTTTTKQPSGAAKIILSVVAVLFLGFAAALFFI